LDDQHNYMNSIDLINITKDMFISKFDEITAHVQDDFTKSTEDLSNALSILRTENEGLKIMNNYLVADKKSLQSQVEKLEDDHRNFTKVSKIIAIENENTKLRLTIEDLKKQINLIKDANKKPEADEVKTNDLVTEVHEEEEDDNINVREKKIGKVIYYVDDDNKVYIKNNDETIGDNIGVLQRMPDGKLKLVNF